MLRCVDVICVVFAPVFNIILFMFALELFVLIHLLMSLTVCAYYHRYCVVCFVHVLRVINYMCFFGAPVTA